MRKSNYANPNEVKQHYRNASIINERRVVFNRDGDRIKGNEFRLIIDIHYQTQIVYIVDLLTHSEYDKVDAANVTYESSKFYPKQK